MIRAALFDLDGVVRRFDVASLAAIEARHGLPPRAILAALLEPGRHRAAVTGRLTDEAWREAAACELGAAKADFLSWEGMTGYVDAEVLALVHQLRVPVGLLTNATSRLNDDLRRLGLHETFDAVVNSSEIGFAKPDARAFEHAAGLLGSPCRETFFVDDTLSTVEAATRLGFAAHHFSSANALRGALQGNGLL